MKRLVILLAALFAAVPILAQRPYNEQRISLFRVLPASPDDIIFAGNSITDGCEWAELFGDARIKNRGISGDRSYWLLDRLDPIVAGQPAKLFLMIGVNDLSTGSTPDEVAANIGRLLDRFAAESPRTEIYVQSILPVNDRDIPGVSWDHWQHKAEIAETNRLIEKLCQGRSNVRYIDLTPVLSDETGLLDKRYTNDGLHLTGAGYLAWKEAIEAYVR